MVAKTSWSVARIALRAVGCGATISQAAEAAGVSVRTVDRLVAEHGRVRLWASPLSVEGS